MRSPSLSSSSTQANGGGDGGCSGKKVVVEGNKKPCCSKVGLKRGPWTVEEDQLLSDYVKREGEGRWRTLPKKAGLLRCGKSCRLRWMNYLRPSVKRGHISDDEEDLILRLHRLLGNRWSLIAGRIPGRTDNEIKNYWNTHLSKKLISQGIDPKTHKPFISLLNPPKPLSNININNIVQTKLHNNNSPSELENMASKCAVPTFSPQNVNIDGKMENIHDHFVDEEGIKKEYLVGNNCDQGIIVSANNGDGDYDDPMMMINCCSDDAFSSFLNSLINDDMFNTPQNQDNDDQDRDQDKSCLI